MSNRRSARLSTGRLQAEEEHNVKVDNGKLQNESLPAPKTTVKLSRSKKAVAGQTTDGQTAPKTQRVAKRKAVKDEAVINGGEVPQTPKKKSKTSASKAPITPSAGAVVASKDSAPKTTPRPRRVEPHATNAPLQTPGGSRVIKKYPSDLLEMSNSQAFRADFATTENPIGTRMRASLFC